MAMNGETLDYKNIFQESRGCMYEGRLQLLNEKVVFKNNKTGKVDTIAHDDVLEAYWRDVAKSFELKLFTKNETIYRFDGFHEHDFVKLKEFLQDRYDVELVIEELSAKGWNWGKTEFKGDEMKYEVENKTFFEIPLVNVSQCIQSKDEVTLEYHQNEDINLISMMEMRFYIPPSQDPDVDRVQEFYENVMAKADVLQVKGNAICTFQDMKFLTPRGHYDVRMYPKFIQLHGKTYDYKITYTSILRLFLLPNKDHRQMFFVISMDPPLKQGQTRYHFLIMLFEKELDLSVELVLDDELKESLQGKLKTEHSGPAVEVVSKIIRHLSGRKITTPVSFSGSSNGSNIITCSYKAYSGLLFPLPRGLMYLIKPPLHIRFEEISCVNFARGASSMNKSFDFEIETRNKVTHIFSSIEKGQYNALFDFVTHNKLRIKNIGKESGYMADNMKGSDESDEEEDVHDPYMYRMQREGLGRDDTENRDDDESDDEDFEPGENEDVVKEEYDSNASESNSEDEEPRKKESESSSKSESEDEAERIRREKKLKAQRMKERSKTSSSSKQRESKKKVKKDPNAPKRPVSGYMLWLNDVRSQLKEDNPGLKITELSKVAGQKWRSLSSSVKAKYEEKYNESKSEYQKKLAEYKRSGGSMPSKTKSSSSKSSNNDAYKSKEYIEPSSGSDDSSSSSESPNNKKKKKMAEASRDEEMQTESEAESSD